MTASDATPPRSTATNETDLSSAAPENRGSVIAVHNFGVEPSPCDAAAAENATAPTACCFKSQRA
jgi:hypothetical protein